MRELMDVVADCSHSEGALVEIVRLGKFFRAEGTLIADSRSGQSRYFIPHDPMLPSDEEAAEIERLAAAGDEQALVDHLVAIGVIRKL